jgi:hypothetical protein
MDKLARYFPDDYRLQITDFPDDYWRAAALEQGAEGGHAFQCNTPAQTEEKASV